jgi:hypothetical protein
MSCLMLRQSNGLAIAYLQNQILIDSHGQASYLDIFPYGEGLFDVYRVTSRPCRFEICSHHNALGLIDVTGRVTINIATIGVVSGR